MPLLKIRPYLINSGSFTGSFSGTGSYARRALTASYVLGGAAGSSGTSGANGSSGSSGASGTSGSSGQSGTAGSSGTSGVGSPGTSGTAGSSGTSSTATVQTGSLAKQTILYNVTSGSQNVITGLNLSSNKWGIDIKEEWDAKTITGDQYYNSCSLLLHCNGANGSTTFTDNSPNNLTVTATNGAAISTAQSKFGGASALFDGTDDYLSTPSSTTFEFGSGNFTIEGWIYPTANVTNTYYTWISKTVGSGYGEFYFPQRNGNLYIFFSYNGSSWGIHGVSSGYIFGALTINAWNNFAITRQGDTIRSYLNGIGGSTFSLPTAQSLYATSGYGVGIGANNNGSEPAKGYVDEIRITKGIARYTGNSYTTQSIEFYNNASVTQYATKYVGSIGGLNDSNVDYGVQKLSDSSLKVVKMTQTTSPRVGSGSLSGSVDRVYVNVLDYTKVSVTSSYATNALTASYVMGGAAGSSGTSGAAGTSGSSGASGTSGTSGTSGNSGTSGSSGNNGTSGSSGAAGSSGSSGATGASGSSGTSGGGASLITGSLYPITSSWSRRSLTASYALNASGGGSSLAVGQTFISNGSQTVYTLSQTAANRDQILVVTNGVVQSRTGSNYTVSGTTLTLSEAVQSGGLIDVRFINAGQGSSGTSGINGTVQTGSIAKQTILYNVISGSQNVITGLNLSGNKWGVDIKEEWDAVIVAGDTYYNSCSLLLHCNGANGSTTFTDNSPSPKTVTSNNGAAISTVQSKFGGASGFFDGTNDYLTLASDTAFGTGTGNFTIEFWMYPVSVASGWVFDNRIGGAAQSVIGYFSAAGSFTFTGGIITTGVTKTSVTANSWYHIACVRSSGTAYLFVNGISAGTDTVVGSANSSNPFTIGSKYDGTNAFNGYIDDFRYTKGVARYTGNFTPPSTQFPDSIAVTQYATKYVGLIGGLNDRSVDYGVQKLSDSSLKVVKMTQTTSPFPSGSLSASVDRVYVNVLDYTKVNVTSSYATNSLTASYASNSAGGVTSGKVFAMTLLFS